MKLIQTTFPEISAPAATPAQGAASDGGSGAGWFIGIIIFFVVVGVVVWFLTQDDDKKEEKNKEFSLLKSLKKDLQNELRKFSSKG